MARGLVALTRLFKGLKVQERAGFSRIDPGSRKRKHDAKQSHNNEAHDPHSPTEAEVRHELLENHRENNSACAGASKSEGDADGAAFHKVSGDQTYGRTPDESHAQASTHALCQEDLPEAITEGSHHDGKHLEYHAAEDGGAVVAGVEEAAGEASHQVDHEDLDRDDPRHSRSGQVVCGDVIGLEQAPRVQVTPSAKESEVSSKYL